jgi:hypothetical protein
MSFGPDMLMACGSTGASEMLAIFGTARKLTPCPLAILFIVVGFIFDLLRS